MYAPPRLLIAFAVVVPAALAGCVDEPTAAESLERGRLDAVPDANEPGKIADATGKLLDAGAAPTWNVGDWWEFKSPDDGHTYAVSAAGSDSYTVLPKKVDAAVYDAVFDISFVGSIKRADLSGRQEAGPVKFFDFPLSDGKTWKTTWDGFEVTLTAKEEATIPTPLGPGPGFSITGIRGNETFVEYTYSPVVKWWTKVTWGGDYSLELIGAGANYTGELYTAEATTVVDKDLSGNGGPIAEAFDIAETVTHVTYEFGLYASEAAYHLRIIDPENAMFAEGGGACMPCHVGVQDTVPAVPGTWHAAGLVASAGAMSWLKVSAVTATAITMGA